MKSQNKIEYKNYIRPFVKSQSVRIDLEMYKFIELIRCLNSNKFASPSTSDIVRILLEDYVNNLYANDKTGELFVIEATIAEVLNESGFSIEELMQSGFSIEEEKKETNE